MPEFESNRDDSIPSRIRSLADDPTAMQFAKRAANTDDDDDDDDKPRKKKSGDAKSGPNWLLIIGGGCGFLTLVLCAGGGFLGWYIYQQGKQAVAAVQDNLKNVGSKIESINNLKQIGLAMHASNDRNRVLPTHAIYDMKSNKPILSWRVAILEDLGQGPLFNQIRRDEPWDSAHNKQFWSKMPKAYQLPGKPADGNTYYQVFVSKGSAFPPSAGPGVMPQRISFTGITDGSSNTIFIVEAANPVNWMRPDDISFTEGPQGVPLSVVGNHWGDDSFMACLGDGTVRRFPRGKTTPQNLQAFVTRSGGEVVNLPD